MTQVQGVLVGGAGESHREPQVLPLPLGNRHGVVAGATGTGKTITMQILAEGFSQAGVPVFLADVKGDVAGLAAPGSPAHPLHPKLVARAEAIGLADYAYAAAPVVAWDVFGRQGHPIRATVSEMGPLLLSRLLDLSEAQEGVLHIAFRIADDEGLLLLDLADLRALLAFMGENTAALSASYGHVATASLGAIQRALLVLEGEGGAAFFGEPALALADLMRRAPDGRGQVNVLAADELMRSPRLYATFLLWLLSELFEELPEVGNPEKPVLAFFFDEAHLLFDDAPKALLDKVEQVARLIRSKGVGVYFVTQSADDIPEDVLAQLGNRIQHALRAYTPKERRTLKAAAESFRPNPAFDTATVLGELATGEAIVSLLDGKGVPGIAARTLIRPPASRIGPITGAERAALLAASPLAGRYERAVDRESAFEVLRDRAARAAEAAEREEPGREDGFRAGRRYDPGRTAPSPRRGRSDSLGETLAKTVIRTAGSQVTRSLVRGVLGSLFRGR